ncbi:AAA family ATPase [Bacteroides sp. CR5/BHMF/2]|nr:AAA family ATPase [Bacteroides sp. CR5/BHMF/2]
MNWLTSFRKWEEKLCFGRSTQIPHLVKRNKNIYDSYPDIKIVFTGSSLLEIHKGEADLSRRAVTYHLHGLSFREFLLFEYGYKWKHLHFLIF